MKIDSKRVLIGSDFEMFIKSGEEFICAIPYIDGDKETPQTVSDEGHAIQADGALFEANVPPVQINEGERMWEDMQFVIQEGKNRLPPELEIVCCPVGSYKDSELTDPKARIGGCDPDFSAWDNGRINKKPDLESSNDRCCGAHFHISYPGAAPKNVMRLIRIMDVNLALPLLFVDEDRQRRKLYGKAGCFRFKDYGDAGGVEYRTLSNAAIQSKEIFDFTFSQIQKSIEDYNKGVDYLEFGDRIQEAINEYNFDLAEELCAEFSVTIPQKVKA